MANYNLGMLRQLLAGTPSEFQALWFESQVVPYLIDVWLEEYGRSNSIENVVETRVNGFSYLFDVAAQRLIAAWGLSRGPAHAARDKSRMSGHPLSHGRHYHRGHAIPHNLGGPTDINLVPQRGSLNVGAFRRLERAAVDTPGALYFSYWIYGARDGQTPRLVEQGLLAPNAAPDIQRHVN